MIQKFESICTDHPKIKHLQPHSASVSFTSHQYHSFSSFHNLIDSVLHSHWSLTAILPCSVNTHPQLPPILHQAAESEPFCTHDYRLIHLSAYLLGHLSATAVSNCYHSPSDCIGHATSLLQTLLYLWWLLLFSLFVCVYFHLSTLLCWCWMCVVQLACSFIIFLTFSSQNHICWCYAVHSTPDEEIQQSLLHERVVLSWKHLITLDCYLLITSHYCC